MSNISILGLLLRSQMISPKVNEAMSRSKMTLEATEAWIKLERKLWDIDLCVFGYICACEYIY